MPESEKNDFFFSRKSELILLKAPKHTHKLYINAWILALFFAFKIFYVVFQLEELLIALHGWLYYRISSMFSFIKRHDFINLCVFEVGRFLVSYSLCRWLMVPSSGWDGRSVLRTRRGKSRSAVSHSPSKVAADPVMLLMTDLKPPRSTTRWRFWFAGRQSRVDCIDELAPFVCKVCLRLWFSA